MRSVTLAEAREHLEETLSRVEADGEPVIIRGPKDRSFILMTREQFDAWDETAFIMSSQENVANLNESIAQLAERRVVVLHELVDP